MNKIEKFVGDYFFLSNFYECPIISPIGTFNSSEAYYQSCKCTNKDDAKKFIPLNPNMAKQYGKVVEIRDDWEQVKEWIMYDVVMAKFICNKDLCKKLIDTYPAELYEGNTWGDTYWGIDITKPDKPGENMLGKILMRVRKELMVKVNESKDNLLQ